MICGFYVATFLVSCTNRHRQLDISRQIIVLQENVRDECLVDFMETHPLTVLFYIDGDCSSCMLELPWWRDFFIQHDALNPVLVVHTAYEDAFLAYMRVHKYSFPMVFDSELTIWRKNHFPPQVKMLVLNRYREILYMQDPLLDPSFLQHYQCWVQTYINLN